MNKKQALDTITKLFVAKPGITATAEQDGDEFTVGLHVPERPPVVLGRGQSWDGAVADAKTRWSKE